MQLNKLILLDFPTGYQLGIDLRQWTVGPNFKGIKEIPDGPHYVYYGPSDQSNNTGFMIHLSSGEIVVKKWSTTNEDFDDYTMTTDDIERYNANEAEIDQYLGKYYMDNHRDWFSISSRISTRLIDSLMPSCGRIYSVDQFLSKPSSIEDRKRSEPKLDKDGLVELELDPVAQIHFTDIPKFLFPSGTSDKTKYMLDKTYTLDQVLSKAIFANEPKNLLGELQFSFVCYNLGFVLAAFEQWMAIIDLLSSCVEAVNKYSDLYSAFLTVLHHQLNLTDEDFADITTSKNRFFIYMKKLFEVILDESNATDELKVKAGGLKESISKKYDWNFDEELDDEQPVFVDACDLLIN